MAATFFIAFLNLLLLSVAAQPPPPPAQQPVCVAKLVAFSPCLSYVSAPPNNSTDFVPPRCCSAFSSVFDSGDGYCFCYILRQPLIFGFPLNQSRVASLSSFCTSTAKNGSSLDSICSSGLPPLPSTTNSGWLTPPNSGSDNGSSGLIYLPPESAVRSPPKPSSSLEPTIISSAIEHSYMQGSWLMLRMMIFLLN